jgi:hypothetical protein
MFTFSEPGPSRLAAAPVPTPAVVDPSCSGCMSITCSDAECGTGLTQECTDDCIVVACDDPTHDASSLGDLQLCAECPDQALLVRQVYPPRNRQLMLSRTVL